MSDLHKNTDVYEQFQKSYNWLQDEGYISRAESSQKAYDGEFWNVSKENVDSVKSIPKPVIPLCKNKVDTITSNLLSAPVTLRFECPDDSVTSDFCSDFFKNEIKEMHHDRHKEYYIKKAAILGTAFSHVVFNDRTFGTLGDYKGAIEEEYISFDNCVCSNYQCLDVQKMEYWILRSRKSVRALRNLCDDEDLKRKIIPDNKEYSDPNEINENDMVTCYLKYFRKDGEVYHTLCTKEVEIYPPTALNPKKHKQTLKKINIEKNSLKDILYSGSNEIYESDTEIEILPDNTLEGANVVEEAKFYLYPITIWRIVDSKDSILGVPITKDLINTNKCVNQLYSSCVTSANFNANDMLIVKKGALQGQKITNKAGQVIIDNSPNGDGIRRLGSLNVLNNGVIQLADNIISVARTIGQFNESLTGDDSKDLSGVAIAQRQAQAEKPIDVMRKKMWYSEEDFGKIIEMYAKFYYTQRQFTYELTEDEIIKNQTFNQANADAIRQHQFPPKNDARRQTKTFNGEDFIGKQFYISVEAVQGTKDSDIMLMSVIQSLFLNGSWMNMDAHAKRFFVEMYPLPNKEKFKALLQQAENDYIAQLENQQQQLVGQVQQLQATLERAKNAVSYQSSVITSLRKSYKDEAKAHQEDISARDKAYSTMSQKEKNNLSQIMSGQKEATQDSTGMVG